MHAQLQDLQKKQETHTVARAEEVSNQGTPAPGDKEQSSALTDEQPKHAPMRTTTNHRMKWVALVAYLHWSNLVDCDRALHWGYPTDKVKDDRSEIGKDARLYRSSKRHVRTALTSVLYVASLAELV